MGNEKSNKTPRTRNYVGIVYPDSAPAGWQNILAEKCIPAFISPLHCDDKDPTGEPKKPHWHVMLMFDSVKTLNQAQEIFEELNGTECQPINSVRGYARYLCHLDNPEKAPYKQEDVVCLGGADYIGTIGLAIDKYVAIGEMQDFCDKYNIVSFYALSKYARSHRQDWHRILCDCGAVFMREYLKSRMWSADNNQMDIIDPETGEVLE